MDTDEEFSEDEKIIGLQNYCNKFSIYECKGGKCLLNLIKSLRGSSPAVNECNFRRYSSDGIDFCFELIQYSERFNLEEFKKIISDMREVMEEYKINILPMYVKLSRGDKS